MRLSPDKAAERLQHAMFNILSQVDIEACIFTPSVDAGGRAPDVQTNFPGFGSPATGPLALTLEDLERFQREGRPPIRVMAGDDTEESCWWQNPPVYMLLPGRIQKKPAGEAVGPSDHFVVNACYATTALLDDPCNPTLTWDRKNAALILASGPVLHAGDLVTLDPLTRRLWTGALPIVPPSPSAQVITDLVNNLFHAFPDVEKPALTFHMSFYADIRKLPRSRCIGLYRTEGSCRSQLMRASDLKKTWGGLKAGTTPLCLKNWEKQVAELDPRMIYRLVDVHGLRGFLPREMEAGLKRGEDHQPGTPLFDLRCQLYRLQVHNFLSDYARNRRASEQAHTFLLPSVETADEVSALRHVVRAAIQEALPEGSPGEPPRFGAMVETRRALKNIDALAFLCDTLCFGTNDLTAELTGLARTQLDHRLWMEARGYAGRSPFEVLVPEVSAPVHRAVQCARLAHPSVHISLCGHQVAGYDLSSTFKALEIGFDSLTISPGLDTLTRTRLALLQQGAKQRDTSPMIRVS